MKTLGNLHKSIALLAAAVLCLLLSGSAWANFVKGHVYCTDSPGCPATPGAPLGGVLVRAVGENGFSNGNVTEPDGSFYMELEAVPQNYTLTITLDPPLVPVCPASGQMTVFLDPNVNSGEITNLNFYVRCAPPPPLGQIGDTVFCDTNGNGVQDAGEPGIPGAKVTLVCKDANGNTIASATTTTDANGKYLFTNVPPGACEVTVDVTTVPPPCNNPVCPVTVTHNMGPGEIFLDADFCFSPCTGQIGDFVWVDQNGNGCQDAGEPGIPGVRVDLYAGCAPNSSLLRSTVTDSNGKYLFDGLCAGSYTVSFHTPAGYNPTLANQACNVGGMPADATDSDCDCTGGAPCGICVVLPANNSQNLTIDCGYVSTNPCLELTKTPDSATAAPGAEMGYAYTVTNCGTNTLTNVAIVDDAGTPGFPGDDFTVAIVPSLGPGQSATFHGFVTLPVPLCGATESPTPDAGLLLTEILPSGDIKVTLRQSRNLNDNVYGTPAPADGWSSHSFGNLTGSDKAEFRFTDGTGKVVLDFYIDYLSASALFPSGYGSLGPNGGDGSMVSGARSNVLSWTTTLADNLNSGLNGGFPSPYLVNSPTPEAAFPNWDYVNGYTVVVSKNAFGAAGFGGVTIPFIHNSPAKTGNNQVSPTPCPGCITNIASAGLMVDGAFTVLATDHAIVCTGGATPACLITEGTIKIDKEKIQLPIKNNGTADIFLSELTLSWPQAINGKLKKVSLNGDFWTGPAASSPVTLNSGFNADANRRKIAKGQTKTLVLTFEKNASKTLADYSGTVKFGADASCAITFPTSAPPGPFDCDGHIAELQMRWMGSQTINVVAHYGTVSSAVIATVNNVAPGTVVTVSGYTGSPNDVIWELFNAATGAKIGESQFHVSCSDSTMDGPEDCGSAQGNGKQNIATYINDWRFVGLTTIKGTKLTCP